MRGVAPDRGPRRRRRPSTCRDDSFEESSHGSVCRGGWASRRRDVRAVPHQPAPHAAAVCTGSRQDRRAALVPSMAAPARLKAEIGLAYAIVAQKLATRARELDAAVLQHIAAM